MANRKETIKVNIEADAMFPEDVKRMRTLFLEEKNGSYDIDASGNPTVTITGTGAMVLNLGMRLYLVSEANGVSIRVPIDRKLLKQLKVQYERNVQLSRPIGGLDKADGFSVRPIRSRQGEG